MKTYEGSREVVMPVEHLCHARDCQTPVEPKLLMCSRHWKMVPKYLRDGVWMHYIPGQEVTKRPTREYMRVATLAINAVAVKEGKGEIPMMPVTKEVTEDTKE